MKISLKEAQLGVRDSTTRIPFRYGIACMTHCPQAVYGVLIESERGRHWGYSGDCLPPSWFDKSAKPFVQQISEMLAVISLAEAGFRERLSQPQPLFNAWRDVDELVHEQCRQRGSPSLLAAFGVSVVERALIDAICRACSVSLHEALRENLPAIDASSVRSDLPASPADWLPQRPTEIIHVRQTVGLGDPLTAADVTEPVGDGLPETLETYVQHRGTNYFKIKVSNQLEQDIQRLQQIAEIVQAQRASDYRITLDGNEQYASADEFTELIDAIEANDALRTLWENTLLIEQPLQRSIALEESATAGIRELADRKIVIIDESDGYLNAFPRAIELGYRGVSSKNCKGAIKSILNAGTVWSLNQLGDSPRYTISGEDLCSVGIVATQSDLCLVAALGLDHVERNGHHYHRGLSYLSRGEQEQALEKHGDFYTRQGDIVLPNVVDGKFHIGSLQCVGYGFAVTPDFSAMQNADEWNYQEIYSE